MLVAIGYLSIRYLLWPHIDHFKDRIEQSISDQIKQPVRIGAMVGTWDRFMPSITLQNIEFGARGSPGLALEKIQTSLSWSSMLLGQVRLAQVAIFKPSIQITRLPDGQIDLAGLRFRLDGPAQEPKALRWLLEQHDLSIDQATVVWHDQMAGLAPVQANGVQWVMQNRARSHRVSANLQSVKLQVGSSSVATQVLGPLSFQGDFLHGIGNDSADLKRWTGQAYAGINKLEVKALLEQLNPWFAPALKEASLRIHGGVADARVWINITPITDAVAPPVLASVIQPPVLSGHINLNVEGTSLALEKSPLALQQTRLNMDFENTNQEWRFNDIDLALRQAGGFELVSASPLQFATDKIGQPIRARGSFEPFRLEQVQALARFVPVPEVLREQMALRNPRGLVSKLELDWDRSRDVNPIAGLNVKGEFKGFALNATQPLNPVPGYIRLGGPGFVGLDGKLEVAGRKGKLKVNSGASTLIFPGLFEQERLSMSQAAADIQWEAPIAATQPTLAKSAPEVQTNEGLKVTINSLNLTNDDAKTSVVGSYTVGGKGAGVVDLNGKFESVNILNVHRYLPVVIASPVRGWVQNSITSGQMDQVAFTVKGDLAEFPFREGKSKPGSAFKISSNVKNVNLRYSPGWPAIENLDGELSFSGPGMSIAIASGSIYGVKFGKSEAVISDFLDSKLLINAQGTGPGQDMIRFVNSSPLRTTINDFTEQTKVDGDATLDLRLVLPLADLTKTKVDGDITFANNEIMVDRTIPKFSKVFGQMAFSETGIALKDVKGFFLGGPIRLSAPPSSASRLLISAEGAMDVAGLRAMVDNALTQKLTGQTTYRASIDVQGRLPVMKIESDLVGLGSDLPVPFAKAAADSLPMQIVTRPDPIAPEAERSNSDMLDVQLGKGIKLAFERKRDPTTLQMAIHRGAFGINADPVLPETGFAVAINAPRIDADQWMPILTSLGEQKTLAISPDSKTAMAAKTPTTESFGPGFAKDFSLLPSVVSAAAGEVRIGGRELKNVVLGASRFGGSWRANLISSDSNGYFTWLDAREGQSVGTLTARFTRLRIPKAEVSRVESLLDSTPQQLPGLDISADEFVVDNTNFGKLQFVANNTGSANAPVWAIGQLNITNSHSSFSATGDWSTDTATGKKAVQMKFDLAIQDSGALLNQFGTKDAVKAAPGKMQGTVGWVGSPFAIDFASLNGDLDLDLGKGQFLKVDPGAGKLISVLNLQSLPRRLTFDFSDLVSQGYGFDEAKAKVKVVAGIARTDFFEIKSAQARINITGSADLAKETQDLVIIVSPEFNAGLASLAYVAINPVIGLGSLVAQVALRKPLQEAFSYEIDVKGTWIDPKVEQKRKTAVKLAPDPNTPPVSTPPISTPPVSTPPANLPPSDLPSANTPRVNAPKE